MLLKEFYGERKFSHTSAKKEKKENIPAASSASRKSEPPPPLLLLLKVEPEVEVEVEVEGANTCCSHGILSRKIIGILCYVAAAAVALDRSPVNR